MERPHILLSVLQWGGWGIILILCIVVGLLWARMERQVEQNQADIAVLKSYSDSQDTRMQQEAHAGRERLERRWGEFLMPLLRQHHEAIQSMDPPLEHVKPLPDWLQIKPEGKP